MLLTIEQYQQLTGQHTNIVDMLAMPDADGGDIVFEPPKLKGKLARPADLG